MTEISVLLTRVEQLAAENAKLKEALDAANTRLIEQPARVEKALLDSMCNAAVNCGQSSSCWIAHRYRGDRR